MYSSSFEHFALHPFFSRLIIDFFTFTTGSAVEFRTRMPASRNVLSALAAAAAIGKASAAFGSAFSTGPTSDDTFIVESWATLNLPDVPTDNSGDLSLWVGMGTSNGDLIQSIAENYGTSDWSVVSAKLRDILLPSLDQFILRMGHFLRLA